MKILIVTPFYDQDKCIASVRWTNIARRLADGDNEVYVVTQPLDDMDKNDIVYNDYNVTVARLNQKTLYEKIGVKYFGGAKGDDMQLSKSEASSDETSDKKEPFVRKFKNALMITSMRSKAYFYARKIKKALFPDGDYPDIIITSACPILEMAFGYELKKLFDCPWISDFRDLPFTEDNCDISHRMKDMMVRMLPKAAGIITIAPKGIPFISGYFGIPESRIHLITNGFSDTDVREPVTIKDNQLHIVHTGSLYGGKRRADMLFKAITIIKEIDPSAKFSLDCAGGNNDYFSKTAAKYGVSEIVNDVGFLPREEAIELQNRADVLLSIALNTTGSLPAKLFEYMHCAKPIVNISCGDAAQSDATWLVDRLKLGIAVEEANGDEDVEMLAAWLLYQYKLKIAGKPLVYEPNAKLVATYNHDVIADKVDKLCHLITGL